MVKSSGHLGSSVPATAPSGVIELHQFMSHTYSSSILVSHVEAILKTKTRLGWVTRPEVILYDRKSNDERKNEPQIFCSCPL